MRSHEGHCLRNQRDEWCDQMNRFLKAGSVLLNQKFDLLGSRLRLLLFSNWGRFSWSCRASFLSSGGLLSLLKNSAFNDLVVNALSNIFSSDFSGLFLSRGL